MRFYSRHDRANEMANRLYLGFEVLRIDLISVSKKFSEFVSKEK
jgi:hypothetical protein